MNRIITYMIDKETGLVFSRVGGEVAVPVLDYKGMTPENNFKTNYYLEKISLFDVYPYCSLKHTKKVPIELKNRHRKFWGMKTLIA